MRRLVPAILLLSSLAGLHAATGPSSGAKAFDAANDAWDRGDYIAALNGYIQILSAPGGDAFLEPIALQTGELFRTHELTTDGRAPRFSQDGRFIAYETGLEVSRRTRIVRNEPGFAEIANLPGVSATFASAGSRVAYLKLGAHDDLLAAIKAIDAAPLAGQNRNQLVQALNYQILKHTSIVIRDLATGRETEVTAPDLMKAGLVYAADGRTLYFHGGREEDTTRSDIYALAEGAAQPALVADAPGLKGSPVVDPSGAVLLYVVPVQPPFRRPQPPAQGAGAEAGRGDQAEQGRSGRGTGGGRGGQGRQGAAPGAAEPTAGEPAGAEAQGGGRGGPQQPRSFGVVDLAARKVTIVDGTAPALSGDGQTLGYVQRAGTESSLMVGSPLGTATAIRKGPERFDAPSFTRDGSRVAFQVMQKDDWEIAIANRDGSGERRLTRDIQHDLLPRFIRPDTILAVQGEARHRRSFLYRLPPNENRRGTDPGPSPTAEMPAPPPKPMRLFHNNTVRTIAPEYQWVASPDGNQVLIGAERDGDTVSPARGVYLVDLRQKVSRADVVARLNENLKSETTLKAAAVHAFAPIAADVRAVVAKESVARVYSYEKALFDFDSKHITRPGNRPASEYLFNTYTSFGYEPEYQWFEPRNAFGGKTANVIATLKGTVNPELVYVVSSHYDSVVAGPGADDDSSGTAALLEAARVMADHPMPATIVFASFTGEEGGLLGSREFVRRAVESKMKIAGALNNDMIGYSNDYRMDNTIRYSNAGIRDIQHGAAMLFTKLITYDALYFKSTDAASYYDAYGDIVGGIGSYPVLSSPHYHQATDLLEYENHQQITETSKTTVATLMLLASSPSRITGLKVDRCNGTMAALSWTPSPEKAITSYLVTYGPPSNPRAHRLAVTKPSATIPQLPAGSVVSVKAVNARGLEGWDWAKVVVGEAASAAIKTSAQGER